MILFSYSLLTHLCFRSGNFPSASSGQTTTATPVTSTRSLFLPMAPSQPQVGKTASPCCGISTTESTSTRSTPAMLSTRSCSARTGTGSALRLRAASRFSIWRASEFRSPMIFKFVFFAHTNVTLLPGRSSTSSSPSTPTPPRQAGNPSACPSPGPRTARPCSVDSPTTLCAYGPSARSVLTAGLRARRALYLLLHCILVTVENGTSLALYVAVCCEFKVCGSPNVTIET
jgi:hypothetical protein